MARSDATKELRAHEPNVHIESEVHVARAKAMVNMPDDFQHQDQSQAFARSTPVRKDPPAFTRPLASIHSKEGQNVRMEVNYVGFPTPVIHWYREGVEIQPSRDFQITNLHQKSILVIPEVFLEDAGVFSVRAVSAFGMAECSAALTVEEDLTRIRDIKPDFFVRMHDLNVTVGEPATFDCQVIGQPRPEVYWNKNNKRVTDSPRWKLIAEEDHYTLLIYEVRPEDAGVYECVLTNKLGKTSCSARLNVTGKPVEARPAAQQQPSAAPRLVEPLRDLQVNEGEPVQLRCRVTGAPEPAVQWYYNNVIIKPSKYFQLSSEPGGVHTLNIAGVFPEDDGAYRCTARNPAGEVASTARLRVIPLLAAPAHPPGQKTEPPRFVKPINGLDVPQGGQAMFEVILSGLPAPEVTWYHEGRLIQPGPDFQIMRAENRAVLIIREVLLEDAGIITVRATNPAGVAECSAELFIRTRRGWLRLT
jgi:hypothetical protein